MNNIPWIGINLQIFSIILKIFILLFPNKWKMSKNIKEITQNPNQPHKNQRKKEKKEAFSRKQNFKKTQNKSSISVSLRFFLLIFFYFFPDKILCQCWAKVRKCLNFLRVLFMMSSLWTVKNIILPLELSFPQHRARCSKYLHPYASLYSPV